MFMIIVAHRLMDILEAYYMIFTDFDCFKVLITTFTKNDKKRNFTEK